MKTIPIVKQILGMLANLFSQHRKKENQKGFEMRKILLVLIMLFSFSTLSAEFLGNEHEPYIKGVKNYYINGVGNSRKDAENTCDTLHNITGLKMEKPLYNHTMGIVKDLFEAAVQKIDTTILGDVFIKNNNKGLAFFDNKFKAVVADLGEKYREDPETKQTLTDLAILYGNYNDEQRRLFAKSLWKTKP